MRYINIFLLTLFTLKMSLAQDNPMNQGGMISKNGYHEILFVNTHDEIVESILLKGNRLKFILDTGAPLAISKEVQNRINYPVLLRLPFHDANNKSDTISIVSIDTFRLADLTFANIPAVVLDFKNSPIGCENVDGIIGSNLTRFMIVQFNLKEEKIILTDSPDKIKVQNGVRPYPVYLDNQSNAFFRVTFNTVFSDTAHFDSGMGKFYDMHTKKAEQLIAAFDDEKSIIFKGSGVINQGILGRGDGEQQYVLNADLELGSVTLKGCHLSTTRAVSRIGRELLNYGTLTINYPDSQYFFDSYRRTFYIPNPNFGFKHLTENGKVTVGIVWEKTPAEECGLAAGCEILSVNRKTFENLNSCEIDEILSNEFGQEKIDLMFKKNGSLFNSTLYKLKQ